MDVNPAAKPTEAEKERFLKKIQEWRELGFEVDELEDLSENDFNEFLRRRHQMLKEQVNHEKQKQLIPTISPIIETKELETEMDSHVSVNFSK